MHLFHHEVMSSTLSAVSFSHKDRPKYSCNILILVFSVVFLQTIPLCQPFDVWLK